MWGEAVENAPWWAALIIVVGMGAMATTLWLALWRVWERSRRRSSAVRPKRPGPDLAEPAGQGGLTAASAGETQAGPRKRLISIAAALAVGVVFVGVVLGILDSAGIVESDGRSVLRVVTIVMAGALAGGFLFGVGFAIWTRLNQREE